MQLKTNHWLAIGVVTLSVLWLLSGVLFGAEEEVEAAAAETPPLQVVVQTLDYRDSPGSVSVSGRTEANHAATAQARAMGYIVELPVAEGERVERGQTIARLSDEARTEAVREAQARLDQARAAYQAAAGLAEDGFYPTLELEQRRAEQAAAQAALDRARAEAARGVVTAPVDGVLDRMLVEPGEAVSQGTEIARISDQDPIIAAAEISDAERRGVTVGDVARVTLQDGAKIDGRVRFVSASADAATATYRLEVEIANPDGEYLAGQIADIALAGAGSSAAQIARSAITLDSEGVIGVKHVLADDTVAFSAVDIVRDEPTGLWISGPPDGANVIVRGQEYASVGVEVEPVRAAQSDQEALVAGGRP